MKTYDLIKKMLEENPELRNDKELLAWTFWKKEGTIKNESLNYNDFKNGTKQGTINRTRRTIQSKFPELGPNETVKKLRKKKQETKGTFIFRDEVKEKPRYKYDPEKDCYVKVN